MEIKSVVFYKTDFENLYEIDRKDRAEIIEALLGDLFFGLKPELSGDQTLVYKIFKNKILRSVKKYHAWQEKTNTIDGLRR